MEESNEIYERVVSILREGVYVQEEGLKSLEQLYDERGTNFRVEDVGAIAETFFAIYNKIIDYYKELKDGKN